MSIEKLLQISKSSSIFVRIFSHTGKIDGRHDSNGDQFSSHRPLVLVSIHFRIFSFHKRCCLKVRRKTNLRILFSLVSHVSNYLHSVMFFFLFRKYDDESYSRASSEKVPSMVDVKDLKDRNLQALVVVNKASRGRSNKIFYIKSKFSKIFSTLTKFDMIIQKNCRFSEEKTQQ